MRRLMLGLALLTMLDAADGAAIFAQNAPAPTAESSPAALTNKRWRTVSDALSAAQGTAVLTRAKVASAPAADPRGVSTLRIVDQSGSADLAIVPTHLKNESLQRALPVGTIVDVYGFVSHNGSRHELLVKYSWNIAVTAERDIPAGAEAWPLDPGVVAPAATSDGAPPPPPSPQHTILPLARLGKEHVGKKVHIRGMVEGIDRSWDPSVPSSVLLREGEKTVQVLYSRDIADSLNIATVPAVGLEWELKGLVSRHRGELGVRLYDANDVVPRPETASPVRPHGGAPTAASSRELASE